MNTLSWLIYLADVAEYSRALIRLSGWAIILASMARTFVSVSNRRGPFCNMEGCKWYPRMTAGGFAILLLSAAIPSQTTVYAIAASELGESALNSETGGKAVEALNAWLDKQIAPEDSE